MSEPSQDSCRTVVLEVDPLQIPQITNPPGTNQPIMTEIEHPHALQQVSLGQSAPQGVVRQVKGAQVSKVGQVRGRREVRRAKGELGGAGGKS